MSVLQPFDVGAETEGMAGIQALSSIDNVETSCPFRPGDRVTSDPPPKPVTTTAFRASTAAPAIRYCDDRRR